VIKRTLISLIIYASIMFCNNAAYSGIMPKENPMPDTLDVPVELLSIKIPDKLPSLNYDIDMPKLSDFIGAYDFLANETENVTKSVTKNVAKLSNLPKTNQLLENEPFVWPVAGGRISSHYGFRLGGNEGRIHHGIDIPMPHGSPIVAARSGVVKRADSVLGGYGKLVIIDHGKGIETRYGHCSEFAVQKGDTVGAGQVIAYVGSTGNSTANHLHFEILYNGIAYNPLRFLDDNQLLYSRKFTAK